ncbi:hypothetical protein [Gordonia aurantiaca]|uniref:hypothetical protein n=1 Tax=Gordonia sp. B21 TaxID=3151852 RepID=UPI003264409B
MPKTIVALTRLPDAGDVLDALSSAKFLDVCRRSGAERVQVNISDDPVAGAMRISELDPPIEAVVTLHSDDDDPASNIRPVLDAVEAIAGVVGAWAVTERTPLDPNVPADGSRADALSNIAFLRRPAELDREEWLRIWLDEHTTVAIETQATFGYHQNIVERALTPGTPQVDAIVEELFPVAAVDDIHAFYGSGGDQAELERRMTRMLASVGRFGADRNLDVVPTSRYDFALR